MEEKEIFLTIGDFRLKIGSLNSLFYVSNLLLNLKWDEEIPSLPDDCSFIE